MLKNSLIFMSVTALLLAVSFAFDRDKTIQGIKRGLGMLRLIAVPFLNILILIAVVMTAVPSDLIRTYLGAGSGIGGPLAAALIGSISLIPGFIAYPIAAFLIGDGASYATVATFMTTLMMVGIVTLPLEIRYFGRRVALLRNALNFIAALIIGAVVGMIL